MRVWRLGLALVVGGLLFLSETGFAADASPATKLPEAAARLEKALAGLHGLRAEFLQIRTVDLSGEEIQGLGFLAFREPDAFRLVYTDGDRQEIVVAGDSLWVWSPLENQAMHFAFDPTDAGSEVILLFGGSSRRLGDVFRFIQEPWAGHEDALRLEPLSEDPSYPIQDIRLLVDERGFPRRFFYREMTGDVVVFHFTSVEANPKGVDAMVRLDLPPGADVLDGESLGLDKR